MSGIGSQEAALDEIFANKIVESHEFRSWLLSRTKFAKLWPHARLLKEEQAAARAGKPWWKNWWCRVPEYDSDLATNIFVVFEIERTKLRFALHIENIGPFETFGENESESYKARALYMMNRDRFLSYMDFETVLLAPREFILNDSRSLNFDRRIPYETIAGFAPQFAIAERVAA